MSALKSWMSGERENLIWIDYGDYATEVIAGGAPWTSAANVSGALGQAQALLSSDVLSLDVARILFTQDATTAEDPLASLLGHVADEARLQLLTETVDALVHGGGADLVLSLPGLKKSLRTYGATDEAAADFGNLDDLGAAFTGVIRALAEKPVSGLLLSLDEDCGEDEFDALGPVIAAATHYDWVVASELTNMYDVDELGQIELENPVGELVLFPQASAPVTNIEKTGGGLSSEFWYGKAPAAGFKLQYGRVPKDARPEMVLTQRATL